MLTSNRFLHACTGSIFHLLLLLSIGCLPLPLSAQQTGPPPVADTPLTPQQKAELGAINEQAVQAFNTKDFKKAEELFETELVKARLTHNMEITAKSLYNLGAFYQDRSQFNKAADAYRQTIDLFKKLGQSLYAADSLNRLGNVYQSQGQFDRALVTYEQTLEIYKKPGNSQYLAISLNNLGNAYRNLGQYDKALYYHQQALELNKNLGNALYTIISFNNLGLVYWNLSQYDQARHYLQQALDRSKKLGNPQSIAMSLNNLGNVYQSEGQFDKALDTYEQALELYRNFDAPQDRAQCLNNLGLVYESLGQLDKALDYLQQALELRRTLGNLQDLSMSLANVGGAYLYQGQFNKAQDTYEQALESFKRIGNAQDTAKCLNDLGEVCKDLGQFDKALKYHQKAMELIKKQGNSQHIAANLNNQGGVYESQGQHDRALDCLQRSLKLSKRFSNTHDIAYCLNNLGGTYRSLHKLPEAEASFAECRKLLEELTEQVADPSQIGALQETFHDFYERYAQLLLERNRPEDALILLEAGRGQGLARQVDLNSRGDITRYFTPNERAQLDQKTHVLLVTRSRQRSLQQLAEHTPPAAQTALTERIRTAQQQAEQAEREYDLLRQALFLRHPDLRRAIGQPAHYAELKTLANQHRDTLYLEYGIVDDRTTLLFALGAKDSLKPLILPTGMNSLKELTLKWRQALAQSGGRGLESGNQGGQTRAQTTERNLAQQAYTLLLGQADKLGLLAPGRYHRMVIAGSGPLLDIPLAALCDRNGKRLIERFPLAHTLSWSLLLRYRNPRVPKASLLCIADPTGEPEIGESQPETRPMLTAQRPTPAVPMPAQDAPIRSPTERFQSLFRAGFAPLPGARDEGKAVAGLYPGAKLLVGPQAQEAAILKLLPDYGLLHFATHGFVVPRTPLSSGLVLAEEPAESQADGVLSARKILNLPLSARLAVLSACETGRGQAEGGEGLMGLTWAFRAAGCPAVVASQWQVNDAATRQWMVRFYQQLKTGKTKDEALQAAMLAVKKDHPSPYYWAAFELIGDTSALPQ